MSDQTPSISKTAFACPHCGAFTTQHWFEPFVEQYPEERRTPSTFDQKFIESIRADDNFDTSHKEEMISWATRVMKGKPFFEDRSESRYLRKSVTNLSLSECYNCRELSIWIHDRLLYPNKKTAARPAADLPAPIKAIFEEARSIFDESPRGAAALLRLCVQMLCAHLGEKGKKIDDDIASLVSKGLNPLVQKSLDIVRVIGNEAVHPGEIDVNDNRDVAAMLFDLVNSIVEQMITHPKNVGALYAKLPEDKRKAIEKRDAKK